MPGLSVVVAGKGIQARGSKACCACLHKGIAQASLKPRGGGGGGGGGFSLCPTTSDCTMNTVNTEVQSEAFHQAIGTYCRAYRITISNVHTKRRMLPPNHSPGWSTVPQPSAMAKPTVFAMIDSGTCTAFHGFEQGDNTIAESDIIHMHTSCACTRQGHSHSLPLA